MSSSMKATVAMLLGALMGFVMVAYSLDILIPEHVRRSFVASTPAADIAP